MRGLQDRVVLVTGGGSGIGESICNRFAEEKTKVAILDKNVDSARVVSERINRNGGESAFSSSDISDYDSTAEAILSLEESLGPIELLVNCAGWDRVTPFSETTESYRDKVIAINLKGPINVTHIVTKGMAERGFGRVVTISSDGGRIGSSGQAVYVACKAGVVAWSKTLAREYARNNLTFNAVAPGPTNTPMMDSVLGSDEGDGAKKILAAIIKSVPLRRIGEPEDVAGIVVFLASDEAAFITGQIISVSGGLTMIG